MTEPASVSYLAGKAFLAGPGDWSSKKQAYGLLLATEAYEPKATHRVVADVRGELDGGGYERRLIDGRAVIENADDECVDCVADPVAFKDLQSTQAYRWIVVFLQQRLSRRGQPQRFDARRHEPRTPSMRPSSRSFCGPKDRTSPRLLSRNPPQRPMQGSSPTRPLPPSLPHRARSSGNVVSTARLLSTGPRLLRSRSRRSDRRATTRASFVWSNGSG